MQVKRRNIFMPDWLWEKAQSIALQERLDKKATRHDMTASRVIIEAATGKRPPLTGDIHD